MTLLGLLRAVEWAGDPQRYACPLCQESQQAGHRPGCALATALRDLAPAGAPPAEAPGTEGPPPCETLGDA